MAYGVGPKTSRCYMLRANVSVAMASSQLSLTRGGVIKASIYRAYDISIEKENLVLVILRFEAKVKN